MAFRILTVCTGNICRSPMAEYMLRGLLAKAGLGDEVVVDSAATSAWEVGNPMDPRAERLLARHGIDGSSHRARRFDPAWYRERDLILAMDTDHHDHLRGRAPDAGTAQAVHLVREFDPAAPGERLGIADPWYGDEADFRRTADLLADALPGVVDAVRGRLTHRGGR